MADSLLSDDLLNTDASERESILNKWKDKTKEEILEAKINSDLFIKTKNAQFDDLKKDYLSLREQNQTSVQLKEFMERLEKERNGNTGNNQNDTTHDTNRENVVQSLKPEDIENLVTQKLSEAQLRQKQMSNFNSVEAKLKEQFGENYQAIYKQRLDTLGLTKEFADDLAKNHPTVFMKTFELDQVRQNNFQAPPKNQSRPSAFAPKTGIRDWNYYQELKKNDPRMYLDPKISVQMHNDMMELGSAFGMPED